MLKSVGLQPRILAERSIPFRAFVDRAWLDKLGGETEGLYSVRNGTPTRRCTSSMRLLSTSRFSVDGGFRPP